MVFRTNGNTLSTPHPPPTNNRAGSLGCRLEKRTPRAVGYTMPSTVDRWRYSFSSNSNDDNNGQFDLYEPWLDNRLMFLAGFFRLTRTCPLGWMKFEGASFYSVRKIVSFYWIPLCFEMREMINFPLCPQKFFVCTIARPLVSLTIGINSQSALTIFKITCQ